MAASNHIAHSLLLSAHPPDVASAIFTQKVLQKPLFLRPTSPDPKSQDRRAQRRLERLRKKEKESRRRKPKPLSAREKRISGIYDIPKSAQNYEIYAPLHTMWLGYMWEILAINEQDTGAYVTAQSAGSKLASADYHGAKILVVRSRCTSLVGLAGIVVRDTKFTFQIITQKNDWKTIPKRHTIFRFELPQPEGNAKEGGTKEGNAKEGAQVRRDPTQNPDVGPSLKHLVFELHGSQFENRAPDRATKKYKQKNMSDL